MFKFRLHELKNKTRTQAEFFHIFNELQRKGKQLVFTSDKPPKEIVGIEDRIRTRLSSALLIDIQQPDLETRIAILKKTSQSLFYSHVTLPPETGCGHVTGETHTLTPLIAFIPSSDET